MILATRQKIVLARSLSRTVIAARSAVGAGPVARCRRRRIEWQLDLREGIDFAIWLLGSFEGDLDSACTRLIGPGSVVIDIGANMGAHTLPLARAVGEDGKVYAVEPTRAAFDRLVENVSLNPSLAARVETIQAMLVADANQPLEGEIFASWPLSVSDTGSAHPLHLGVAQSTSGARPISLDALLVEQSVDRVDLIKLDVDGFEMDVLTGAVATLETFRPAVAMELAPYVMVERGLRADAAVVLLRDHGYEFRSLPGQPLTKSVDSLISSMPHGASVNLLALPA